MVTFWVTGVFLHETILCFAQACKREALDHGHLLGDNLVLCTSMRAFKILLNLNKLSLL